MRQRTIGARLGAMFAAVIVVLAVLVGVTVCQFQQATDAFWQMLSGPVAKTLDLEKAQDNLLMGIAELRGLLALAEQYADSTLQYLSRSLDSVEVFAVTVYLQ